MNTPGAVRVSSSRWLVLVLLAAGCDLPGKPDKAQFEAENNRVREFAHLFKENCAGCHGTDGKLGPAPMLNDPLFRGLIPEDKLRAVLTSGRKGTLMPAFDKKHGGTLTADQIDVLVYEIMGIPYTVRDLSATDNTKFKVEKDPEGIAPEGIAPTWGKPETLSADTPRYEFKGRTSTDYEAIRTGVFEKACKSCHGDRGQGMREGNKGAGAINNPAFLSLMSPQVLRRIVITGRSDLGMPNYARADFKLTSQQIADIVALLESWKGKSTAGK